MHLKDMNVQVWRCTLLYGGMRTSSLVCAGICEGVSIVSCNKTCSIDIR
jgi:hypothetical protein